MAKLLAIPFRTDDRGNLVPYMLHFESESWGALKAFMEELEPELDATGSYGTIPDWGTKLAGGIARIAAILHMTDHCDCPEPWDLPVAGTTVERAITIGRYLTKHAFAAFEEMGADPATENAKRILEWIMKKELKMFTKRDAHYAMKSHFKRAGDLDEPLNVLVERGYVRPLESEVGDKGGRPSSRFEVNPAVHDAKEQNPGCQEQNPG